MQNDRLFLKILFDVSFLTSLFPTCKVEVLHLLQHNHIFHIFMLIVYKTETLHFRQQNPSKSKMLVYRLYFQHK